MNDCTQSYMQKFYDWENSLKKYKLVFEFNVWGTKTIEAKNETEANEVADKLQRELSVDEIEITSHEAECNDITEIDSTK